MSVVNYVSDTAFNAVIGVPCGVIDAGINAVIAAGGVVATALSVLTAGKNQTINDWAEKTREAKYILPNIYSSVVGVINPGFKFDENLTAGVVTSTIARPFFSSAMNASLKEGFFARHIVSRLSYAVAAVASVVSRVADLAIGLAAAVISIIPCVGRSQAVNNFAIRHLLALGVVADICAGARGFVNPQQFVRMRQPLPQSSNDLVSDGSLSSESVHSGSVASGSSVSQHDSNSAQIKK